MMIDGDVFPCNVCRRFVAVVVFTIANAAMSSFASAAGIVGFHDVSDTVKTMGWVCSTIDTAPLKVSMYADSGQRSTLLDTQVADKRRDDLSSLCAGGSVAHAFRFSDYAARSAEVYGSAGSIAIRILVDTPDGQLALAGTPRAISFEPVGIWDSGLIDGRWRTDRDNPLEGTRSTPLLLGDCAPASNTTASELAAGGADPLTRCRYGSTVTPSSNAATSDATWPTRNFWALIANVENSFDNPLCIDGPPGQSREVGRPGTNRLFGIVALPDGEANAAASRRKMHLVLNSVPFDRCRTGSYGIPHLSFGAQADRGNGGVITYLNRPGAKTTLRFGMTLMDIADSRLDAFGNPGDGNTRSSQAQFVVEAIWGGRKRWLIVEVLPDPHTDAAMNGNVDAHVELTWHLVNSFLYPGADFAFKSASVLTSQCAAEGVAVPTMERKATWSDPSTRGRSRIDYSIDLQKAFTCLARLGTWGSEPMPSHAIPITGIHFGIGQDDAVYRDGVATVARLPNAIWVAVDGVRVE